jgi:hypothetical protein
VEQVSTVMMRKGLDICVMTKIGGDEKEGGGDTSQN